MNFDTYLQKNCNKISFFKNQRYEFIKQTIVYINAQSIMVVCPNKCLYMEQETSTLKHLIENEKSTMMTFFR